MPVKARVPALRKQTRIEGDAQARYPFNEGWLTLALAFVSSLSTLLLRLQGTSHGSWLVAEFLCLAFVSIALRGRLGRHYLALAKATRFVLGMALVCTPLWSSLIQSRLLGRTGEATELVWLGMMQNAAIWQAAVASTSRDAWISFLLSGFLMLFGVSTSDRSGMILIVLPYGLLASWWLMDRYWQSIETGFIATESVPLVRLRVGMATFMLATASLFGWLAVSNSKSIRVLDGFMPTSGGRSDSDPSGRQGVGDGDMLVAARDQAFTFGPVDSDLFLDSQAPSMYDLVGDLFGEPKKKKSQLMRAIALENEVQEAKEEGTESKKSGREFSALRQPVDRSKPFKPAGTDSKAVLQVIGTSPMHLRVESFDSFDGRDWTQAERSGSTGLPTEPVVKSIHGKPWMQVEQHSRDIAYPVRERLTIKVINFRSQRVPATSLTSHVHIDRIDQPDFFSWTRSDRQLIMPHGDNIPPLTVMHQMYQLPHLHPLRDAKDTRSKIAASGTLNEKNNVGLSNAFPFASLSKQAEGMIQECSTRGVGQLTDWQKVEAIVRWLRSNCVVDPMSVPPETCEDVVQFLLDTKRGPDYLIASTACVLIQSIGIPCRLATGFYVAPSRYDYRTGQTEVMPDDLHAWAEVLVHGSWVPVEPSATYDVPREFRSWQQWAIAVIWASYEYIVRYPLTIFSCVATTCALVFLRRRLLDAACSVFFATTQCLPMRNRVLASVFLLRWRLWVWSIRQPNQATVQQWLDVQLGRGDVMTDSDRQIYIRAVQRLFYAPRSTADSWISNHAVELRRACWAIIRCGLVDLIRIKSTAPTFTSRN